ncbi:MAG TPA: hypothetical protein VHO24_15475 [Opitutaceae bacterium]|nr:hypothetical protein [Opitutaceae bacterium]
MPRRNRNALARSGLLTGIVLGWLSPARAIEVSEWKTRQPFAVEQAGIVKFALPPATLDLARPGLEDLRVVDAAGREIPFFVEEPRATETPAAIRTPKSLRTTLGDTFTQILIATGTDDPLDAIVLVTPAKGFIKAARVELSPDGETWETISPGTPVFRQYGSEQLRLSLEGRRAAQVRITIDDTRSPPVPFMVVRMASAATAPRSITMPLEIRVLRREEFAGESVLTLDLGAANVPLAALEFVTTEPLFIRKLTFSVRGVADGRAIERILDSGPSIYRVALDGLPPSARLEVPVGFTAPSRELFVHIANDNSPPLTIQQVKGTQHPRWLAFRAAEPGTFALLTGNPRAAAPRYDLALLATSLKATPPRSLEVGPAEPNPLYRRPDALADTPLPGAAIDVTPWKFRKAVSIAVSGVQELELDLDVLAGAQSSLADVRLVREGTQLPYLLERSELSRSIPVTVVSVPDAKRPRFSRWEINLPRAGLPLTRLTLHSSTPLFQRHLRLFETTADERDSSSERTLAAGDWAKTPGNDTSITLTFVAKPTHAMLTLETDNGDNPPIAIFAATAAHPVARLLFKADAGTLALYYGNPEADVPRYDLALVAGQILTAEKSIPPLGSEEIARSDGWARKILAGAKGGALFWTALALVVAVLLIVIAKLLPKPSAATDAGGSSPGP